MFDRQSRGVLAGCIPAILFTIGLIVVSTALISARWSAAVQTCRSLWTYPNGTIIEDEQPGVLQITGVVRQVIETPDPQPRVIVWYTELGEQRRAAARAAGTNDSSVVYPGAFRYTPLPNGGTRILLICP